MQNNTVSVNGGAMFKSAEPSRPTSTYGILQVFDGGAAGKADPVISDRLQELVDTLQRKKTTAERCYHLIGKYEGGAGKDHPSRVADMALWTEHQEQWDQAAQDVANYTARNVYELSFKAEAANHDPRGSIADAVAGDVMNLFQVQA